MNHVMKKIRGAEQHKWRDADRPTEREQEEMFRRVREYLAERLVGLDLNPNLVKASKITARLDIERGR